MIESQTAYLRRRAAHDGPREGLASVEVSAQAQDDYMEFARADVGQTVWALGGCTSWYQDDTGEATAMWPRSMWSYRRLMSSFEAADHVYAPPPRSTTTGSVA